MKILMIVAVTAALMMTGCNETPSTTAVKTQAEPQKVLVILKPYPVEVCNSKIEKPETSK